MVVKTELLDDRIYRNIPMSLVCADCIHLTSVLNRTCEAFPQEIPRPIWTNKIRHKQPYKGDNGIIYKRMTDKELKRQIKEAEALLT